jgi:allophanate hydrolase subunit 2
MASLAANSIIGNNTGTAATPLALTAAQVKSLLAIAATDVSGFDTQVRTNRLDQLAQPAAAVQMNSQRITSLASPIFSTDAATKGYVDSTAQGLDAKQSVKAATTANIATFGGLLTIDGVTLAEGDRVLVKNQTHRPERHLHRRVRLVVPFAGRGCVGRAAFGLRLRRAGCLQRRHRLRVHGGCGRHD